MFVDLLNVNQLNKSNRKCIIKMIIKKEVSYIMNFKKFIALALVVLMMFSIASCGKTDDKKAATPQNSLLKLKKNLLSQRATTL